MGDSTGWSARAVQRVGRLSTRLGGTCGTVERAPQRSGRGGKTIGRAEEPQPFLSWREEVLSRCWEGWMHPNVALLRALYDAQGRGDIDAYLGMLSDAIIFHIPGRSRIAGDYVGKQSVRRHFEEIFELSGGTF